MANTEANRLSAALGPSAQCLAIDDLATVLEGRRGESARQDAGTHLSGCAHCQTEMALLREFESPVIRPEERRTVDAIAARLRKDSPAAPESWWDRIRGARILVPAIGFAVVLLAVTVGIQSRRGGVQPYVPAANQVLRSRSVEVIGPQGGVATAPAQLEWRPAGGASQYQVRLMEVDRNEIWTASVSSTSVTLPESVRAKLSPLKTLLWQVKAVDKLGGVIAESEIQRFRVNR